MKEIHGKKLRRSGFVLTKNGNSANDVFRRLKHDKRRNQWRGTHLNLNLNRWNGRHRMTIKGVPQTTSIATDTHSPYKSISEEMR